MRPRRPSLDEVTQWFAGAVVPDDTLASYVTTLSADPTWLITDTRRGDLCTLTLQDQRDGVPFQVVLCRTRDGWIPRLSYPLLRYSHRPEPTPDPVARPAPSWGQRLRRWWLRS